MDVDTPVGSWIDVRSPERKPVSTVNHLGARANELNRSLPSVARVSRGTFPVPVVPQLEDLLGQADRFFNLYKKAAPGHLALRSLNEVRDWLTPLSRREERGLAHPFERAERISLAPSVD
jgi:hypothetical protein